MHDPGAATGIVHLPTGVCGIIWTALLPCERGAMRATCRAVRAWPALPPTDADPTRFLRPGPVVRVHFDVIPATMAACSMVPTDGWWGAQCQTVDVVEESTDKHHKLSSAARLAALIRARFPACRYVITHSAAGENAFKGLGLAHGGPTMVATYRNRADFAALPHGTLFETLPHYWDPSEEPDCTDTPAADMSSLAPWGRHLVDGSEAGTGDPRTWRVVNVVRDTRPEHVSAAQDITVWDEHVDHMLLASIEWCEVLSLPAREARVPTGIASAHWHRLRQVSVRDFLPGPPESQNTITAAELIARVPTLRRLDVNVYVARFTTVGETDWGRRMMGALLVPASRVPITVRANLPVGVAFATLLAPLPEGAVPVLVPAVEWLALTGCTSFAEVLRALVNTYTDPRRRPCAGVLTEVELESLGDHARHLWPEMLQPLAAAFEAFPGLRVVRTSVPEDDAKSGRDATRAWHRWFEPPDREEAHTGT